MNARKTVSNVVALVISNFPAQYVLDGPKEQLPPPSRAQPQATCILDSLKHALPAGRQQSTVGMAPNMNSAPTRNVVHLGRLRVRGFDIE